MAFFLLVFLFCFVLFYGHLEMPLQRNTNISSRNNQVSLRSFGILFLSCAHSESPYISLIEIEARIKSIQIEHRAKGGNDIRAHSWRGAIKIVVGCMN